MSVASIWHLGEILWNHDSGNMRFARSTEFRRRRSTVLVWWAAVIHRCCMMAIGVIAPSSAAPRGLWEFLGEWWQREEDDERRKTRDVFGDFSSDLASLGAYETKDLLVSLSLSTTTTNVVLPYPQRVSMLLMLYWDTELDTSQYGGVSAHETAE